MKLTKKVTSILLIAFLLLTAVGCSKEASEEPKDEAKTSTSSSNQQAAETQQGDKKAEIRFAYNWSGADTKAEPFEGILNQFAEANSDKFSIMFEATPGMDHMTKIQVDTAGYNLPDVFIYWGASNLNPLVQDDMLLNMDEYFAASQTIKKEDFNAGYLDAFTVSGTLYGVPIEPFMGFLLANKTIFDQYGLSYPKNFEDMKNISETFNANGIIPFAMTSKGGDPSNCFFSGLVYQSASGYKEAQEMKDTWTFNTDSLLKAAQAVESFREFKMIPEDTLGNGGDDNVIALYNEKKAAMVYTYPWMIGAVKDEIVDETDVIPMFDIEGSEVDAASFTIGGVAMGVVINKESFNDPDKKDAIVALVDQILSDEMFSALMTVGNFPTKAIEVDETQIPKLSAKVIEATKDQVVYSIHEFFVPSTQGFQAYKDGLDELFAGAITAEEFGQKIQKAMDDSKE